MHLSSLNFQVLTGQLGQVPGNSSFGPYPGPMQGGEQTRTALARGLDKSSALETQPPLAFQATKESVALLNDGYDFGMAGMDQRPWTLQAEPAVAIGEFLHKARFDSPV